MVNESNKTDKRQKINIWLDSRQLTALEKIKASTLAPIAALVREAVDEYLERRKRSEEPMKFLKMLRRLIFDYHRQCSACGGSFTTHFEPFHCPFCGRPAK